ncbi:HAMP domain-containing protein [Epibacterium ulvae]|uniref:histidine kinase n=1 Tax=Epibacterium ulvae TaxID=1156985 RepID=A0A1G5QSH9_9RHOB|nr:HAMP domain-containing sensor histidine kinase [Epibacterium ulvae]SCZ64626.1 HAMP domain-containing protein [Epibacterium ulvae]
MKLWSSEHRLSVVRRYLLGSLVAALIPLALVAGLYDRYSADLLDNITTNRFDFELNETSAKVVNFVEVQINLLKNIANLPDTTVFFTGDADGEISQLLEDLLLLETESPDIYAIELADLDGNVLQTIPRTDVHTRPSNHNILPLIFYEGVEILGPVLPEQGLPGWYSMRIPVFVDQQKIGFIGLRARLASLTELASPLLDINAYEPHVVVFDRIHVTTVGTQAAPGKVIAQSGHMIPGWKIRMVQGRDIYQAPKTNIRYLLLVAAVLSAIGLIFLFLQMSERLTRYLKPLSLGAREIANGNFSVEIPEDAPGELGMLARSYNRMRDQLSTLIDSRVDVERRAALGNMAAGIAHEIRNPLTTVSTAVHGLKRSEPNSERRIMLETISSEILRVDQKIQELLDYARPRFPELQVLLLVPMLKSIETLIASTAHAAGITVNVVGDSSLSVKADEAHLRQILLNLTLNALQATPVGGHVNLRAYRDEGHAILIVADDGRGMSQKELSKILRPFYTTREDGSGLGLSVTKQLVEANGGQIEFESEQGVGTTISVSLPVHDHQGERGRC